MLKYIQKKDLKQTLFEFLLKNAFYLVTHVEGSKILDKFVNNVASSS
jgi:hypothetical protein